MKTFTILKKNVVRKRMATLKLGLTALFLLFAASLSNAWAATYYLTTTGVGTAGTPGNWNTGGVGGGGTAAANFTTSGDIFIVSTGQAATCGNATFAAGVTLQIDGTGTISITANGATLTVNGTVTFGSASTSQITLSASQSGQTFTLGAGATLKTVNTNGISGTNCSLPATATKATVNLNTAANYELNGSSAQATLGLPATVATLTINNAAGVTLGGATTVTTLTIGSVTGSSVFADNGNQITCTGTLNLTSGTFKLGGAAATTWPAFASRNISAGTTVEYASAVAQTVSVSPAYQILTFSGAGQKNVAGALSVAGDWSTTLGVASMTTSTATVTGNVAGTGAITFTSGTLTIGGAFSNSGTFTQGTSTVNYNGASQTVRTGISYNNLTLSGSGTKTPAATLTVNGNLNNSVTLDMAGNTLSVTGTTTNTGGIIRFSGANGVAIGTGTVEYYGAAQAVAAGTYNNLTINQSSGAASLGGATTVNGTLTFVNGMITTGANNLIIGSIGSVAGAGSAKYVNGNLQKVFLTGPQSFTFDIGDATSYTPAALSFANITTGGNVTAKTTSGQHPNISTSGINSSKDVNRYWTLTNSSIVFTNYSAIFTFVAGDVIGGANTSDFVVRNFNSPNWTTTTIGTKTATSTQATALTLFSDFAIGEQQLHHFALALSSPQTNGVAYTGTNTLTAQDLLSATVGTFDASANNVTIAANAPLIGTVSGLSGVNKLTSAGDFVSGVANLTTLGMVYSGNAASGIFTSTSADGKTGTSGSVTVNVGTVSKLVVTLPGQTFTSGTGNSGTVTAQTAGTAFNIISITATDANFNTVTSYSGSKTISYTGPTGTPSYMTAVSFTSGQSTTTLATTLTKAEATTITAGDGTITGPASSSLTVASASMNKFAFSLASPQTNAAAFTGTNTLTAQDTYGNTVTPFNASSNNVTITASPADGTITGLGSGNSNVLNQAIDFTSGIANIQNKMIFTGTIGSHTFTATSSTGGYTGTSGSVTINAATYVWNHSVSTDWQVANNWTPLRTTATTSDILAFNGGGSVSVTNVPTQTIAQLLLSNSSTVNLQPAASSNGLTVNDVLTTTAGDILNLGSGIILGGTLTTLINSGRIQSAVITTTSATPIPASLTWGGTVEYNGSGAQTAVGGTYTTLEINNSTGVTLANAATVTTLTMADVTSGSIFNDGGFAVSTATTLNLNSGTYNCSASAFPWETVNAGTGTVDFNGTGPQTVPCLPYYSLRISGARTTNTVTLSSTDTIHVASGFMPVATFSGTGGYATTGTIFEYNGSAAQNVAAFTYNTLIMTNGGSNAKTFIGTDSVRENLVINGNATAAGGSGNVVLFGNWTNNGTFSAGTSTVEFGGVPPTTINGASTFNTLAVNKQDSSTAITLNNNINVGTLTMTKGTMQTGSNSVTITGTRTGNALILGAVTRTHAFALSTPYAFEGPNTLINFTAGSTPSSVTVTVAQTTPTSPTMIPVDRSISISTTGGSFTATLRLHYENSETDNLDELGLRLWKDSSGTWLDRGATARDSVNNYVELSGITAFSSWAIGASASSKTLVDNNGGSVNAGDTLTYTVTIVNPYKSTKPTINVNDALSSKFILVPGTISNSGAIAGQVLSGMNLEGGTITWPSFSLAGGASVTRTFQLRSDSTISPSQTIANTARIDYGGGKVEYVSVSVTLTNLPNITITNAVDNIKPVPGDVLTFTLSVRNNGTSNATNITLNTAIPNNTTFNANGYGAGLGVQDDGVAKTNASDGDGVTYGGGSITVTISSLAPGTTTQIKFKTTVN
jgi:hypothetical protein